MDETTKNKLKRSYFFWAALIFSIVTFLIPYVASVILGLEMGWHGILPPCRGCDDPNTGGQMFAGFLIFIINGLGALLMLFSEILSLIFLLIGYKKKEMIELAIPATTLLILNIPVFILALIPGSPFFVFAEFITKVFFGCKCYGNYV